MDCYAILQIPKSADAQQIKRAYRKIALRNHPDKNKSAEARKRFMEATVAYRLLKDKQGNVIKQPELRTIPDKPTPDMSGRERDAWYRQRNAEKRAYGDAERYARTAFDDFAESRIFKTAMVLNSAYDYVFLILGVVLCIAPWVYYWKHEPTEAELQNSSLSFDMFDVICASSFGMLFTLGIYTYLFKNQNKAIL